MGMQSNPTKSDVKEFCNLLERELLAAIDRGAHIEIGYKQKTKDIADHPAYGTTVVDVIYVGAKFKAEFRERGSISDQDHRTCGQHLQRSECSARVARDTLAILR
jgi:hypothetical protein